MSKNWRTVNAEKFRAAVMRANKKRELRDPAFVQERRSYTRQWQLRNKALIGTSTRAKGFRSEMEEKVLGPALARGATYESRSLAYSMPRPMRYTPDAILPNGIAIEVKGHFSGRDRAKLLAVKAAHPALDLRMVLARPQAFITRTRTTRQHEWCERHGIPWSEWAIPESWWTEPVHEASKAVLEAAHKTQHGKRRKYPLAGEVA